jgi:glycosyltransferase involved in cell wall biosynthesis
MSRFFNQSAATAAATAESGAAGNASTAGVRRPRRVLHVQNVADLYGGSRMLLRWLKNLDRRRFEPIVVMPGDGPLKALIEAEGIEVILHPRLSMVTRSAYHSWRIILFLLNYPVSVLHLWWLIRRRRVELVYTNTAVIISPALAAWLARVPHVWHVRECFQEFRRFWTPYSWYLRTFSAKVIAISNAVAAQFEPRDKVMVIHDAFSLAEGPASPDNVRGDFRALHGLGEHFVVGCVGRIKFVRKGQEVLVQAAAILKRRGRPIKALIVGMPFPGNESHLERLRKMIDDLDAGDCVVFAGELPDPRPAYAAMDALAMTSVQPEPFGGVVSEAMSLGLPVIATNLGGSLDQVLEGVTGLLVPPGDPAALADAIEKLMRDPGLRERMGVAAADRIRTHFSTAEMIARIGRVLEEAIAKRR